MPTSGKLPSVPGSGGKPTATSIGVPSKDLTRLGEPVHQRSPALAPAPWTVQLRAGLSIPVKTWGMAAPALAGRANRATAPTAKATIFKSPLRTESETDDGPQSCARKAQFRNR